MRLFRFVILLPPFLIAEAVLWIVACLASHVGFHQSSEIILKHRQLLDWLWGRRGSDARKWGLKDIDYENDLVLALQNRNANARR